MWLIWEGWTPDLDFLNVHVQQTDQLRYNSICFETRTEQIDRKIPTVESFYRNYLLNLDPELVGGSRVVRRCLVTTSPGRPTDTGLQLDKACYPCSR